MNQVIPYIGFMSEKYILNEMRLKTEKNPLNEFVIVENSYDY